MRVLLIECEGAGLPRFTEGSPEATTWGPFEIVRAAGLDAAAAPLSVERFEVVVVSARPVDARRLLTWPALSQAVADPALLVVTTEEPGVDLAIRLIQRGAQDVLPAAASEGEALSRAVRLAAERKEQERAARKAYATDLMTGLPNQQQLLEHVSQLLALREREPAPMALIALRIEGLSTAEATLGRESANVLRRKIAVRLRAAVRASDVVASTGDDAFGVLLSRFQDVDDAERVGEKLIASLLPPFAVGGRDVAVAAAIGIAQYPDDGKDAGVLLKRAAGVAAGAEAIGRGGFANRVEKGASPAANDPADPHDPTRG